MTETKHFSAALDRLTPGSIALIGVPWDENSSFLRGPAGAPEQIRQVLADGASTWYSRSGVNLEGHPRIMENGLAKRLVQVGIRTLSPALQRQVERYGVEVIRMQDWSPGMELYLQGPVYLSLDLDALDPAFAPGVSHHEPGGFTTREVLQIIDAIQTPLVGADIVELNPRRDQNQVTARLAAVFYKEIAAKMIATH